MELKDVDYVLAVAQYRNISLAAQALYISQPALSKYLSNLEKRLGLPLFLRSGRSLSLTPAGEIYVRHARQIADIARRLREELSLVAADRKGHLSVGVVRSGWQKLLPDIVKQLQGKHPEATFRIVDTLSIELEQKVLTRVFDLGLATVPPQLPGLGYDVIEESFVLLSVPAQNPLARRGVAREGLPFPWIDIHHFSRCDYILQERNCRMRLIADEVFRREGFVPNVRLTTESTFSAVEYASSGLGVCMITDDYISQVSRTEALKFFCVGEPVAKISFGAIYQRGADSSPLAKDFIRLCKAEGARRMLAPKHFEPQGLPLP